MAAPESRMAPIRSAKPPAGEIAGTARVIDGDPLEIDSTHIRLHGINAPESHQTCRRPVAAEPGPRTFWEQVRDWLRGASPPPEEEYP